MTNQVGAGASESASTVNVTKHHGWGNDFLVIDVTDPNTLPEGASKAELARALCERRTGIGADGLLFLDIRSPGVLGMELFNADGSRAEMSGNGIRCLVQAAHLSSGGDDGSATWPIRYRVETDAGVRHVDVLGPQVDGTHQLSVEMGAVDPIGAPSNWDALGCLDDRPVRHLSLGNPHSVVAVGDVDDVDLLSLGRLVPDVNLEIVEPGPEPDSITMRVHERGAGLTTACGTGACAAAEAAIVWGFVSDASSDVRVHMPGGEARVRIDASTRRATLIGPAVFVASMSVRA